MEMAIAFEANSAYRIGLPEHDLTDRAAITHYAVPAVLRKTQLWLEGKNDVLKSLCQPLLCQLDWHHMSRHGGGRHNKAANL